MTEYTREQSAHDRAAYGLRLDNLTNTQHEAATARRAFSATSVRSPINTGVKTMTNGPGRLTIEMLWEKYHIKHMASLVTREEDETRKSALNATLLDRLGLIYQELLDDAHAAQAARLQGTNNDMALRIDDLRKKRVEARKNKDFELADAIRDEIVQAGFQVQDAALGGGVL
jgi:cysteinyl-tRNA synthetase